MVILTPPPAAPQRGDRTTFANRVDAFITWLINFVTELVSLVTNLNSLAAGGAYAIPYTFKAPGSGPGFGTFSLNSTPQNTSTILYLDEVDARGATVTTLINQFYASSSAAKGSLRIQKVNDPSKFLNFDIVSAASTPPYSYRTLTVTPTGGSAASPFADGDSLVIHFQRTGDKGDPGPAGAAGAGGSTIMRVRDDRAAGVSGDTAVATTWATRTLNAVAVNSISGASLSSNVVTLPAGTFRYAGTAGAAQTGSHQAQLYNVSDGTVIDYGTTEFAGTGISVQTRSTLRGQFTIAAPKQISLRHWASAAGNFGTYAATGGTQVYAELIFEKVA